MTGTKTKRYIGRHRCGIALAALALAGLTAGCSTDRIFGSSSSPASDTASQASAPDSSPSVTDRVAGFFSPKRSAASASGEPFFVNPLDLSCPPVDVRLGASTLTIPPGDTDAFSLRYQGTIGEMARECKVVEGIMTMKVGVRGRVLVGPSGGPGTLDLPLRFAVVREGPEPQVIVSKLHKIPVTIPEGAPNVVFSYIDEDVTFPRPSANDINAYIVYVGFDPLAEPQKPAKKPAKKPAANPRTPTAAR